MKISFVIPAYNEANYLAQCLSALFREIGGRKDIEVIVVNNAKLQCKRIFRAIALLVARLTLRQEEELVNLECWEESLFLIGSIEGPSIEDFQT